METLRIYEIDYSCSPNGTNQFEVYADIDNSYGDGGMPIYTTDSLIDACQFCYDNGVNFNVYTLAQYNLSDSQPLTNVGGN